MQWYTYIVRCADDSLYTGITTDLKRREAEHNGTGKGAKYTKPRQPVLVVYSKKAKDRSTAATYEASLKKLSRKEKLLLIQK